MTPLALMVRLPVTVVVEPAAGSVEVMVGGVVSGVGGVVLLTLMVKVLVDSLPAASVAVIVTV